ncbi:MAG TPA: hypothetical protein VMB82_10790, partial [Acidimicrobiales bacterium]|nr:hypothetical protein [Acidimicrobiales bacterium]
MADEPWARHLPLGADRDRPWSPTLASLPANWAASWSDHPSAPVLLAADGSATAAPAAAGERHPDPRWCTAGELDERTRDAAARLATAGLTPGDRL